MISQGAWPRGKGRPDGLLVRLADGGDWVLPYRDPVGDDPEYDALLEAVCQAEDRSEGLRAELALTIFLMDREYHLSPSFLDALLSFEPESPDLIALQNAVHGLVLESMERSRSALARARESTKARPNGTLPQGSTSLRHRPRWSSPRLF